MTFCINKVLREFLFLLLVIYFSQGSIYPNGSYLAKIVLSLILLISSFYFILTLLGPFGSKDRFYYAWSFLIFLNLFGYIFEGNFGGIHLSQLKKILAGMLPFFPFYYFARQGHLKQNDLLRFALLLLPVFVLSFYSSKASILQNQNGTENIVTNTAYLFVTLIPYLFLMGKRKVIATFFLLFLLYFIIQGAKRGALVVGLVGSVFFMLHLLSSVESKNKLKSITFGLIIVIVIIFGIYDFYIENEFLVERMNKVSNGGSGRDLIYSNLLKSWYESDSVINYLFGFGFVATIKYSGTGHLAHNDWLELLINFGLFGVFVYLFTFYSATSFLFNSHIKKIYKLMMLCIISMWLLQTMFSMYYTSSSIVFTSVLFAYLFGEQQYKRYHN